MHNVTSFPEKHFPANPNVQKRLITFLLMLLLLLLLT